MGRVQVILKNLTDREIILVDDRGEILERIYPEPQAANVNIVEHVFEYIDGFPVVNYEYKNVSQMPQPQKNVVFIVKYAVLKALNNARKDVVAPDTSPSGVLRDRYSGKVLGVRKFQKL